MLGNGIGVRCCQNECPMSLPSADPYFKTALLLGRYPTLNYIASVHQKWRETEANPENP
jgi:hypothetical protein